MTPSAQTHKDLAKFISQTIANYFCSSLQGRCPFGILGLPCSLLGEWCAGSASIILPSVYLQEWEIKTWLWLISDLCWELQAEWFLEYVHILPNGLQNYDLGRWRYIFVINRNWGSHQQWNTGFCKTQMTPEGLLWVFQAAFEPIKLTHLKYWANTSRVDAGSSKTNTGFAEICTISCI